MAWDFETDPEYQKKLASMPVNKTQMSSAKGAQ